MWNSFALKKKDKKQLATQLELNQEFSEKSTNHFNWLVYEIDLENNFSCNPWNLSKNFTAT